jgi:hypothetical protein
MQFKARTSDSPVMTARLPVLLPLGLSLLLLPRRCGAQD